METLLWLASFGLFLLAGFVAYQAVTGKWNRDRLSSVESPQRGAERPTRADFSQDTMPAFLLHGSELH